jgi:TonB family protein
MQSLLNATPPQPDTGVVSDFHLLIEPEPWLRMFVRHIGDLFRPTPPQVWITSPPAEYWPDALVDRPAPWSAIRKSFLGHVLVAASIYGLTWMWLNSPHPVPETLTRMHPIEHYELSEYLPPVNSAPAQDKPKPPVRHQAQEPDPEYAPQEIVSINENHNSIRQTIVNPVTPKLLQQDTPLPNIVAWTAIPGTAPVAPNHRLNQPLPIAAPQVVPPIQDSAKRNLNALEFPLAQQQVVPPAAEPTSRNLAAMNVPVQPQAAVPPSTSATQRKLGDINLALNTPTVEEPKLSVPQQQAGAGQQQTPPVAAAPSIPPAPPVTAGTGKSEAKAIGQLLALNVHPVAPTGPVSVPEGNRPGEFAAGPSGRPGATARPEIAAGPTPSPAANQNGSSTIPSSIFVAAPPKKILSDVVVAAPLPSAPTPKADIPTATAYQEPNPSGNRIENQVFGDRKYYSMSLNMPNLASAGGSWIIRFAELNPVPGAISTGLSAPVPIDKVDPAYPAALMRDRIEGVVVLRAIIHSDGRVGEIQVLQSLDEKLDENARVALTKWRFRPGTKNGAPVDLEAVIKIPFRAPRAIF